MNVNETTLGCFEIGEDSSHKQENDSAGTITFQHTNVKVRWKKIRCHLILQISSQVKSNV